MAFRSKYSADAYEFTDGSITVEFDRIHTNRNGDIVAEAEVRWNEHPLAGLVHHGKFNITSDRSAATWANACKDRIPDYDWRAAFIAISYLAKERYRTGDPPIVLADVDAAEQPRWLIRPLVEHGGPTVVAAPGGSAKSFMALSSLLTVCTGRGKFLGLNSMGAVKPGLYLDWESDQYAHANRMEALCAGAGVDVPTNLHYRREYAPLTEGAAELARHVRKLEVGMVVVDSKGAALAGAPEEATEALKFFRACRQLGVPVLIVDHVTNEQAKQKGGAHRPFGSVYTQNMARNIWMVSLGEPQDDVLHVVWKHTKSNNGRLHGKLAWQLSFEMDKNDLYTRIGVKQIPAKLVTEIREKEGTLEDRIAATIDAAGEACTVAELAYRCETTKEAVRSVLSRSGRFENVSSGQTGLWVTAATGGATMGATRLAE